MMISEEVKHFIPGHPEELIPPFIMAMVFSAAARALPEPLPMGNRFYLFFYRLIHNLLANFDKVQKTQ